MNHKYTFIAFALLGAQTTLPAVADEIKLDEIIVSAGRTPLEAEKVGRAYTVIKATDIERSQTRYVSDLLRRVPGIAVSRTGSLGGLTQIRMRGAEANHVLVLIDGVEVASSTNGEFDFGALLTSDIERIEILRGPQSSVYGSNAMAGVIQIFTKGGIRNDYKVSAQTELGTDRTVLGNVSLQAGANDVDIALSSTFRRSGGFDLAPTGSEDDGDNNATLNGRLNWDITPDLAFNANLRYVNRKAEADIQDFTAASPTEGEAIDFAAYTKTTEIYGGAGLKLSTLDGDLIHKVRTEVTSLTSKSLSNFGFSGTEDYRYHASYQGTYFFGGNEGDAEHSITGALEWERETFRNRYPSNASQRPTKERDLYGFVAEYRGEFFDQLFISGAVRYDRNDAFDDTVTYSTSAAYVLPESNTRFHASLGTGVTNPSFYEQFGFNPSSFQGNPDLQPEENFGWDIGVEQKFWDNRAVIDVTYFNERLEDEISTAFLPGFISTPVNLDGTSDRQGVEVAGSIDLTDAWSVNASYTFLDAEQPDGQEEVRRPNHTAAVGVNYAFDQGNLFLDAIFNGKMKDNEFISTTPQTRVTLDEYVLVNVGADYRFTDQITVYGRIENLFNEDYQEVYGFNTQGTTAFIGLKGSF
ncbi:MAG: TonB-dependent receptor [Sneathiella sp.]|nr:TonB-dependent receptor [Sneathiella sp.]